MVTPHAPLRRILLLVGLCALAACSGEAESQHQHDRNVGPILASTWPLTTLARELLGPESAVECLLAPGQDPAHWTPSPTDLEGLTRARAVLVNGAGLETWLMTANLAPTRLVRVSKGFAGSWIEHKGQLQHSHGARGAHDHVGFDPHVWMDPLLALEQARALQEQALLRGWVTAETVQPKAAALEVRLRELDGLWAQLAEALQGRTLLANHDAYAYPARRHGIAIQVFDADPEKSLDATRLQELAAAQQTSGANIMLFEASPDARLAHQLKVDLGLTPFVLSPAEAPSDLDFIDSMGRELKALIAQLPNSLAK
ncbi:MAG: zinc ABC transporter substrate-binding protein [Planctomycetes bacterium]|nr:zinc ABC transporter substrate-binding protein [Planctomycetota bacterium]